MAGPALCLRRRLWVKEYAMCVLYEIVRCGSQCGGSQRRREIVPPRLGDCAYVGDQTTGAAAAAAKLAPPHLSRSRRLRDRCEGVWASMATPFLIYCVTGHFRPEVSPTVGQGPVSCQAASGATMRTR